MTDRIIVPDLSNDENVTLNSLLTKLNKKAPRNGIRSLYYDGKRRARQVGSVIPPQYAKIAFTLGWAAKAVDGLARRCHLDEMVWPDGDIDALGMRELEDSNFLMQEFAQAGTDSLLHGVSFLITTQGAFGEPRALVHAKDALNATGDWNDRKRRLDNLLSITSRKGSDVTGFVLYLDGETISAEKDGIWRVTDRSTHPWHVPAEAMPWSPRSARRGGRSRITRPVMSHQDAAVRALVRMEAHMDIYAIPKLMLLGADVSIFKNADGSMKTEAEIIMGRMFGIPDATDTNQVNQRAEVKQINAESPQAHLAELNALAKLEARETDLPDSDFAITDMANPTSEGAFYAGRENLIETAEQTQDAWSVPIRRTVMRALAIQNGEDGVPESFQSIKTKWRPAQHLSRSAVADAGAKQLSAGPDWLKGTRVGLELLGLTRDQIDEALQEKRRADALILRTGVAAAAGAAVESAAVGS